MENSTKSERFIVPLAFHLQKFSLQPVAFAGSSNKYSNEHGGQDIYFLILADDTHVLIFHL